MMDRVFSAILVALFLIFLSCNGNGHETADGEEDAAADPAADADADGTDPLPDADVPQDDAVDVDEDVELPPGAVIAPSRRIEWQGHVGVPGGIPDRTTLCATIDAATYGNGTTDAAPAIQSAVESCPEDQVVYLPAGTYRLANPVNFGYASGVALRGDGPGLTILRPEETAAITTGQSSLSEARAITGGSDKGSTSITVEDASGIEPGTILDIIQAEDPDFYWSRGGAVDHTGQFVIVTAVSGTTVEFEDPLVWRFTLNPRIRIQNQPGMRRCGIEDLTVSADDTYGGSMIQFWNAYASWIRNVETAWGNGNEHIFLFGSLRCEVRDCHIHDTHSTTDGYGILTMMGYSGPRGGCTGTLIENNVFSGLWGATILETEVGSVVAYNFSYNMRFPGWPDYQIYDFNGNHGPHGMMVLFEGNVGGGGVIQDGYHGSVSHTTYFRNAFSGLHVETHRTGNIKLIDLCRFSYYHNVVGNVLGSPEWPRDTIGQYEMTGNPGYTEQAVIYRLGYPNMGNNWYNPDNPPDNPDDQDDAGLDPKVEATLLRWGNYDYENDAVLYDPAEVPPDNPVPGTEDLPASLLYASSPDWWPASVPWPPAGPDVTGGDGASDHSHKIPAQICHEGGEMPGCDVP